MQTEKEEGAPLTGVRLTGVLDGSPLQREESAMAQEMSVEELRRLAGLHKGLTSESWLMDWAADEIERLRNALQRIAEMTDADNPESYRCDDREGCFDTVFSVATSTLKTPNR